MAVCVPNQSDFDFQKDMVVSNHSNDQSSALKVRSEIVAINTVKLVEAPNAHLELNCIVRNSFTGEVIREATAEFWLEGKDESGRSRHASDFALVDESVGEARQGDPSYIALDFCYTGAVVSGVGNIPSDWPADVKESIADLATYRGNGTASIAFTPLSGKSREEVLKYLQEYTPGQLWKLYIGKRPEVSWEELEELYDEGHLKIQAQAQQYPARCHFSSPEEALIKLSVGCYVELKWEEMMCDELCKGEFEAVFFVLGPNIVIACVRRKKRGIFIDENAVWDDRMNVILKFEAEAKTSWEDKCMKTVRASGKPVSNQTPIDCDLVVLLERVPQDIYDVAKAPGKEPTFMNLSDMYIDVNDSLARGQVASLRRLFDREDAFQRWWPLFLPEGPSAASRVNFLEEIVGWSKQDIDNATLKVIERMRAAGKPPNQEQRDILMNARYCTSNCKLIWGPPGTGKTTLIVMLIMLYLQAQGVAVLVVAGSNGSTGRLFETLAKWLPKGQNSEDGCEPLRVHKAKAEYDYFMSIFDPNTTGERLKAHERNAGRVLKESKPVSASGFYAHRQAAEKLRHMEDPGTGVAAAVLRAVRTSKLPAIESAINPSSEAQRKAQFNKAMRGVLILQQLWRKLHGPSSHHLSPDERGTISSEYGAVSRYIIGSRRVIVSTVGNATSRILQDCIFRDAKHVVIITDEAGLETDASPVNVLAGTITAERVESEFGGVNPIMTAILVGDHKQGSPLVKSDIAQANEFGPQLAKSPFVRLALSGFPLEHLWEQHRMVETLCQLPNDRNYGGKLRTSREALSRRMTAAQKDFLCNGFGIDLAKLICPPDQERAYFEDQYLRHMLLDVRGGVTQIDPALRKSRFNIANVDITLRFFEAMVRAKFLHPSDIRILTFYNAQRQRYIDGLEPLREKLGYSERDFDGIVVHTSDSFQGREATCIIMDLVVAKYFGQGTLGHAGDEKKTNVAFTRARDFLFVVGDSTILDSPFLEDRDEQVEFIFESLSGLVGRNAMKEFRSSKKPESELAGLFEGMNIKENGVNGIH